NEAMAALRVIRDEAFRCKEITQRLLELSRPGSEGRGEVDLAGVAADVAAMVKGLSKYADRTLALRFDAGPPLLVRANATEMRQVMLNLTVNALEAAGPGGEVVVGGMRRAARDAGAGWVEVSVADNGRGMSEETLSRIFEPFFTEKRGVGEPGTGLGLSITHAIVTDHAGRITATSPGPGKGSRFVVEFPATTHDPASNAAEEMTGMRDAVRADAVRADAEKSQVPEQRP
ncbi:MAG: HAMP domain-containing sensor histidine kinase, partial [Planctomycetota bacterium]|nr:HAMP domain-containing sensor histidine kinase [Planctomycetota bacterium]